MLSFYHCDYFVSTNFYFLIFSLCSRNPCALLGVQIDAATIENSTEVSQKIKNGTALRPSISTSGHIFEGIPNSNLKVYMPPYVHCSIIYNSQVMEATQLPINKRVVKKVVVLSIYNGILLGHKRMKSYHL